MKPTPTLLAALTVVSLLSGCITDRTWDEPLSTTGFAVPADLTGAVAASDLTWPDFDGYTLRILDHGAFLSCEDAGARFTELTNATVECTPAEDAGSALNQAIRDQGDPAFDILYGVDNVLLSRAVDAGVFRPYTPQLAPRVQDALVFFDDADWPATPVDHGYIALNVDEDDASLDGTPLDDLFDVRTHADRFVTEDPRTSTPGLGFLLITIAAFGEFDAYDWQDYWTELFDGGVLVTAGWTEAYETYFTGGYGQWEEGYLGGRPIVTSYTNSPAYEAYYGGEPASVLLTHGNAPAVFHQVQTMGVLDGTPRRAIAEAWIEFTLTDDFQALSAPVNVVYPAVDLDTDDVYGDVDPAPGTFATVDLGFTDVGANLERWLGEWTALCEAHDCV